MSKNCSATLLLLLFTLEQSTFGKKAINIFGQKNGADILQLRNAGKRMFNALRLNSTKKWNIQDSDGNYVIPYTIAARYDPKELPSIRKAMDIIEANTCIRFKERINEDDYIEVLNQLGEGCYTNVGRVGGKGVLMLESNYRETCMDLKTVLHELMHVVGLWHEHMRLDRDEYIKVHYENIDKEYWIQFDLVKPEESTTYNVPYDYNSIMHYEKTAFAKDGKISMETINPEYQDVIGKQKRPSPSDYRKICEIYQCSQCMKENTSNENGSKTNKPDPVAVRPSHDTDKECEDLNYEYCRRMKAVHLLNCSYVGRRECCASCMALGLRSEK